MQNLTTASRKFNSNATGWLRPMGIEENRELNNAISSNDVTFDVIMIM